MFVDLVGSTALSARLDPEDMREIIGAYVPQEHAVFAALGGRDPHGVDRVLDIFPKLRERFDQAAGTLSGG